MIEHSTFIPDRGLVAAAASNAAVAQEGPQVEHGRRLVVIALGVILATLLEMIDTTIVNVALPNIQGNLGATIDEGTYIVTGYIVANVIVVPLTPWLQERFGLQELLSNVDCDLHGRVGHVRPLSRRFSNSSSGELFKALAAAG